MPVRDQHVQRSRSLGRLAACIAPMAVWGLIGPGCAAKKPAAAAQAETVPATNAEGSTPALRPEFARLARRAESEAASPVMQAMTAPTPPGIDETLADKLTPRQEADPLRATMSLDRALADLPAPPLRREEPSDAERQVDPAKREQSLRFYAAGREKLLRGEAGDAAADLRRAAELNPDAPEPWRELGEAHLRTGSRIEAIKALERAAARGLEDPRLFEVLGRVALERGEAERAAALLGRAAQLRPEVSDPVLPVIIDIALGRALAASGYFTAARESFRNAVNRSPQLTSTTRYGEEYSAIYQRLGEVWQEIGDLGCRLGDYTNAIEAYQKSEQFPALDAHDSTPRLVYASMKAGRPSEAALAVLRHIDVSGGLVTRSDAQLLAYLAAHHAPVWNEIAAALEAYQDSRSDWPPTVARGLTLARALALEPAAARAALREMLLASPPDPALTTAYLEMMPRPEEAAAAAATLAEHRPEDANRIAEAVLKASPNPEAVLSELARARPTAGAELVRAYLHAIRGEARQAVDLAAGLDDSSSAAAAALLARIEIGAACGRSSMAFEAAERLSDPAFNANHAARARGLGRLQWFREALRAAEAALETTVEPGARIETLLLTSDLATVLDAGDDAERWAVEALELDPYDDRPYNRLISIYGAGGAKADAGKLNQTIRSLRENLPDCRTLRGARAKELLRRGRLPQAEREAERLLEEEPGDTSSYDLLVGTWMAMAERDGNEVLERGLAKLRERLSTRPFSAGAWAGITTLMVKLGREQEAAAGLEQALAGGAGPDIARILEGLLRERLDRGRDADAMKIARLQPSPRTLAESIELADVLARSDQASVTAEVLIGALDDRVTLLDAQAAQVQLIAAFLAQRGTQRDDPAARAAVLSLLDRLVARGVKLEPEVHERRLVLLALDPATDAAGFEAAAMLASAQHPELAPAFIIRGARMLQQANRHAVSILFLARAAPRVEDKDLDVHTEWFRAVALHGTAAHGRQLIEEAAAKHRLRPLVQRVGGQRGADEELGDERAEAAYILGNYFASDNRADQSRAAYELALTYDPNHAWACNNLGYALVERGEELDRAADLLERAHAAKPDEASITDSLGWLRYKQGRLGDERDAAGNVVRMGAVSLLESAVQTQEAAARRSRDSGESPTILDHAGDAFWLAGRSREARQYWHRAEQAAQARLDEADAQGQAGSAQSPAAIKEHRAVRDAARGKLEAARNGQDIPVAPWFDNPHPRPPPAMEGDAPGPAAEPDARGDDPTP